MATDEHKPGYYCPAPTVIDNIRLRQLFSSGTRPGLNEGVVAGILWYDLIGKQQRHGGSHARFQIFAVVWCCLRALVVTL